MGVYGWGRGTGWYIIAILDSFLEIKDSPEKEVLRSHIRNIAMYYTRFQREDGGFGTFLQDRSAHCSVVCSVFQVLWFVWVRQLQLL